MTNEITEIQIDPTLYEHDVREEAQEGIRRTFSRQLTSIDRLLLEEDFVRIGVKIIYTGEKFTAVSEQLLNKYGALNPNRSEEGQTNCLYGQKARFIPEKNFRLIQKSNFNDDGIDRIAFELYIRYRVTQTTR